MMKITQRLLCMSLAIALTFTVIPALAAPKPIPSIPEKISETAAYLQKMVPSPVVDTIGGEWTVMALARSGEKVPQSYFDKYYATVEKTLKEKKGILHNRKYTEYSRVILALTAIGRDPSNVGGYNLLTYLADYDNVIWQGINGPTFALIALDSNNYGIPASKDAKKQATREMYVDYILSNQFNDGSFALSGTAKGGDPEITAMVLQALSKYKDREDVSKAIDKALTYISSRQNDNGGFTNVNGETVENTVQVIMALTENKIDPMKDSRFIRPNGASLVSSLMSYYMSGGGFKHIYDADSAEAMGSDQGMYAMVAYNRLTGGKTSFYDMTDVKNPASAAKPAISENPEKQSKLPAVSSGKTFADIQSHSSKTAIEKLVERGVLNGVSDSSFEPDRTMTRAEFAKVIVTALGLDLLNTNKFADVPTEAWFNGYVGAASQKGLVTGTSASTFSPLENITVEQSATLLVRAAQSCGADTEQNATEVRNIISQFTDYTQCADWARPSIAFCVKAGIIPDESITLEPKRNITRGEVASMVFALLTNLNRI